MTSPNDVACDPDRLTALVRGGDPQALDQITRCYGAKLLAAGRRHCRSSDEARDAVQDALITAASHLPDYRGEGSLAGWLVQIVATACRRLSRGRKNAAELHDSEQQLIADEASPETAATRRELAERLDAALVGLSPEDRLIVLLAEVEEFSAPEIAARTGLSAGAVRVRLSRARARIRADLASFLEDDGAL